MAGAFAIGQSLYELYLAPVPNSWIVLALLTLFSGTFAIRLPRVPAQISVSETFVFTAVLLFGTAPATIIVALDGLIISLTRKRRLLHRVVFNGAEPAISIWIASRIFFRLAGVQPLALAPLQFQTAAHTNHVASLVLPLVVLTVVYFLFNSWLTAVAVWFETDTPAGHVWRQHFLGLSLNYFGGASVALLIAGNSDPGSYFTLGLIVPVLVISYLTFKAFKTALEQAEDARLKTIQQDKIYSSTIKAFAMSIDAKDQVTHGHIGRVQNQAVELAAHLGVADKDVLKAIETAALLHDMGKLFIPERILNKPGKLTRAEFDRMKLHASVGADLLSPIDFLYPVVPIVRHHHENWDGTGYPDRLAGTDIPIGARILAVVDCFDALTSDRPYRPKLDADSATKILLERRGTMYDPLVVDAFMKIRATAKQEPPEIVNDDDETTVGTATDDEPSHLTPKDLAVNGQEILSLYELASNLAGHVGVTDAAEVILRHLREIIPAPLCALFIYQSETDDIVAVHSSGNAVGSLTGLRLNLGAGVSGWVAANRTVAIDADPRLELARMGVEGMRRACSAPLCVGEALLGVITVYSADEAGLGNSYVRLLESLLPHIAHAVHQAIEFDRRQASGLRDGLTGLPPFASVAQFITRPSSSADTCPLVVVFLDVDHLGVVNEVHGTEIGDKVLLHVTQIIRRNLRSRDLLLRYGGDEFIALLTESDLAMAECVAARLVESVSTSSFVLEDDTVLRIRLASGYAVAPTDGDSLEDLVNIARDRASRMVGNGRDQVVH